jgi:hypothetical protein
VHFGIDRDFHFLYHLYLPGSDWNHVFMITTVGLSDLKPDLRPAYVHLNA